MRLFFDANLLTYIAVFEEFLAEGTPAALAEGRETWSRLQGSDCESILPEIRALRRLHMLDDQARFDWLCSDLGIAEVERICDSRKRAAHSSLLQRLIEHRRDVYEEDAVQLSLSEIEAHSTSLLPDLPVSMISDGLQFAEASLVDADYFLTNDRRFIQVAARATTSTRASTPSSLPFL